VTLADEPKPGDCFRYELALTVDGKLKVERDGKPDAIPLKARAAHVFVERFEAPGRALRHYSTAASESEVGFERSRRELAADRHLIAVRSASGPFSPDGPLTREELELVAEHFDTLALPGLLPGREVKPGETWAVDPETVRLACQFEAVAKADLTGKLGEVKDGVAAFAITGTAEGVEAGAGAKVTVNASGKYDVTVKRLTELTWEQTDDREQGPASPASEVKATLVLKRTAVAEPKELAAEVRAKVPADATEAHTRLRYADPDGRFRFDYPREWKVVGRTRDHLVLRLVEKGEFTAQATFAVWKKADPGKHADPAEFKKALGQVPGWEPEEVLADAAVPAEGRWLYRVTARGKQDGLPVVQAFYLLAGPGGDQIAVTVLARAEKAATVGARDLALVTAIEFPKK
jgi:hypothetical protein